MTDPDPGTASAVPTETVLTETELLRHWRGHRGLTRRTIEAFPEGELFAFTPAPPMRSFGAMMLEVLGMIPPTLGGLEGGEWSTELTHPEVDDRAALLAAWDAADEELERRWQRIPAGRFAEEEAAYGFPERPLVHLVLYLIDNEIHHRAQGFVYLRLLEIEPPSFYRR